MPHKTHSCPPSLSVVCVTFDNLATSCSYTSTLTGCTGNLHSDDLIDPPVLSETASPLVPLGLLLQAPLLALATPERHLMPCRRTLVKEFCNLLLLVPCVTVLPGNSTANPYETPKGRM